MQLRYFAIFLLVLLLGASFAHAETAPGDLGPQSRAEMDTPDPELVGEDVAALDALAGSELVVPIGSLAPEPTIPPLEYRESSTEDGGCHIGHRPLALGPLAMLMGLLMVFGASRRSSA